VRLVARKIPVNPDNRVILSKFRQDYRIFRINKSGHRKRPGEPGLLSFRTLET
jgi:hypothetical protein